MTVHCRVAALETMNCVRLCVGILNTSGHCQWWCVSAIARPQDLGKRMAPDTQEQVHLRPSSRSWYNVRIDSSAPDSVNHYIEAVAHAPLLELLISSTHE